MTRKIKCQRNTHTTMPYAPSPIYVNFLYLGPTSNICPRITSALGCGAAKPTAPSAPTAFPSAILCAQLSKILKRMTVIL